MSSYEAGVAAGPPRIPRLSPDAWDDDVRELLGGPIPGLRPLSESAWLTTLAHNPRLMRRFGPLANHLLLKGRLSARTRELLILRTAWLCQAPYEWGEHVAIAKRAEVNDAEIEQIITGADHPAWSPSDAALVRAAEELHADSIIADATWGELAESFDEATLIELLMVIGMYHLIAWTQNSLRIAPDEGRRGLAER